MPTTPANSRLLYGDANTTPWPLNHHAYVHACADRLGKEVPHPPRVHFPQSQLQRHDTRSALLHLQDIDHHDTFLAWDEQHGWSHLNQATRTPLVLGAGPLLDPQTFTHAVTSLLSPHTHRLMVVLDRSRATAHPIDVVFERRLAAFRAL